MKALILSLLLAGATSVQAQVAAPETARNLAATCANCHGTNGRSQPGSAMPPLAGVDKASLLRALRDYREGNRPATVMHQITKGYTDAQLELIAAYFAAQK